MPSSVSRRSLAKGAAWVLPTAAVAAAAPAYATSPGPVYDIALSYGATYAASSSDTSCRVGGGTLGYLNTLRFSNFDPSIVTSSSQTTPLGFAVVGMPMDNNQLSPTVNATVTSYTFEIAFPVSWIDTGAGAGGTGISSFANGSSKGSWQIQKRTQKMRINGSGGNVNMLVYSITYTGTKTQATVPYAGANQREAAWQGTQLGFDLAVNPKVCLNSSSAYFWTSINASYTIPGDPTTHTLTGSKWDPLAHSN